MPVYQSGSSASGTTTPTLYLPNGWDTGWKSGKAGGSPKILVYGDSIAAGQGTLSDTKTQSWPSLMRAALASKLGINVVADYWANNGSNSPSPGHPWGTFLTGYTMNLFNGMSWHYTTLANGTAASAAQVYTTPEACTAFDVFICDGLAGTWQFVVDTATPGNSFNWALSGNGSGTGTTNTNVTITNLGNNTTAGTVLRRLSITGLPKAIHTFAYGWQSVAYTAQVAGAAHYPNTGAGLSIARMAVGQAIMANILNPTGTQTMSDCLRLLAGFNPQQDSATSLGFGFPAGPHDLCIISMYVNDQNGGSVNLSPFEQGTQKVVQAVRRANPSCSVLMLVEASPNAKVADCNSSWGNQLLVSQFIGAIYRVAHSEGCAVANLQARWGETPFGQGFLPATDIHPTVNGHADIWNFISPLL